MNSEMLIKLVEIGVNKNYFSKAMQKKIPIIANHYRNCKECAENFDNVIRSLELTHIKTLEGIFNPFDIILNNWICGGQNNEKTK